MSGPLSALSDLMPETGTPGPDLYVASRNGIGG